MEGEFEFAGRDVRWDVSWNRGESRSKTNNTQLVEENYREALDLTVDGNGDIVCASGNSECVPLNIFGYVTDPAVIDYVTLQGYENSKLTQRVITANMATDLTELPGGDWQMAVGYENREENGDYQPDYFLANGLGRTAALEALNGGFDTEEFYIETRLPLLAEDFLPVISAFDVEVPSEQLITHRQVQAKSSTSVFVWLWMYHVSVTSHSVQTTPSRCVHQRLPKRSCHVQRPSHSQVTHVTSVS